jgi:hypothetical protein
MSNVSTEVNNVLDKVSEIGSKIAADLGVTGEYVIEAYSRHAWGEALGAMIIAGILLIVGIFAIAGSWIKVDWNNGNAKDGEWAFLMVAGIVITIASVIIFGQYIGDIIAPDAAGIKEFMSDIGGLLSK